MLDLLLPSVSGGYAKGHENREAILQAALKVLVDEGYAAMTMRRVAKECGLKFGNLTYYYRSHNDLVHALLEAVVSAYEVEFDRILQTPVSDPSERLKNYCRLVLDDLQTRKTTHVFPEIWALSNHSDFVAERMNELYRRARAPLLEILLEMRPDLPDQARQDLALFVSASMEGLTVFIGHNKAFNDRLEAMFSIQFAAFLDAIKRA